MPRTPAVRSALPTLAPERNAPDPAVSSTQAVIDFEKWLLLTGSPCLMRRVADLRTRGSRPDRTAPPFHMPTPSSRSIDRSEQRRVGLEIQGIKMARQSQNDVETLFIN